jgi:hypothetical protein
MESKWKEKGKEHIREREREKVDWLDFYSERRIRDMLYESDGGRRIEEEEVG